MIPPACNLVLTFTAKGGAHWVAGSRLGYPLQIGHRRHWEKTAKRIGVEPRGGGRKGGRRWGERKKERKRKAGAKEKRGERWTRETKIREARKQISVEVKEEAVWEIVPICCLLQSLGALGEGRRWVFRGSGRLLWEVETTDTNPWAPNKKDSLIIKSTHWKQSVYVSIDKKQNSFHLLWFLQPSCCFLSALDAFISPLCAQYHNEGQYVRKREFTQRHCSAAQGNIKDNHRFLPSSSPWGCEARYEHLQMIQP